MIRMATAHEVKVTRLNRQGGKESERIERTEGCKCKCVCLHMRLLQRVLGRSCCLEVSGLSGDLIISSLLPLVCVCACACAALFVSVYVSSYVRVCNNLVFQ